MKSWKRADGMIRLSCRRGFTLMEFLTVAMIIAVVASIGLPAVDNFFSSQRVAAEGSKLVGDIRLARSNAIVNQVYTRLVFSDDLTSWVVQELTDTSGNLITGEPTTSQTVASTTYDEETDYWRTVLDDTAHSFDPNIDLEISPNTPPKIFCSPEGMLMSVPDSGKRPIGVTTVKLTLGLAEMTVTITPSGVLESEAWYTDDE